MPSPSAALLPCGAPAAPSAPCLGPAGIGTWDAAGYGDAQGHGDAQRMSQFAQAAAEETLPGCLLPEQPIGVTSRRGSGGSGDAGQGWLQPRKFVRLLCTSW